MKKLKLFPFIFLIAFPGCAGNALFKKLGSIEKNNQSQAELILLKDLWQETLKITGLPPNTPMPEISFLKRDLYEEIASLNCNHYPSDSRSQKHCLKEQERLEKKVELKLGEDRLAIYQSGLAAEQKLTDENCNKYKEGKTSKQCEDDQEKIRGYHQAFGRSFMSNNLIEIYVRRIDADTPISFGYKEREVYFYGVVAHEDSHLALHIKNPNNNSHHEIMLKEKYLEKLIDFLSRRLELKNNENPKNYSLKSLKMGIEADQIKNQTLQRLK